MAKSIEKRMVDVLIGVPLFFVLYILGGMYLTHWGLYKDLRTIMREQFDIRHYTIRSADVDYWIFDPSGLWWIELEEGFDIQKIKNNKLFWGNSAMPDDETVNSNEVSLHLKNLYDIDVNGFEAYFAEDQPMGSMTMCSDGVGCNIYVYAKDGDKNLFIAMYSM